ncbi:toxin-antitoxin system YwqK family antitoxin [Terribacillus saccharophilus]|uniref:toxin-antitoxin system YwqK family antitoxin n=1 Tax=Terribacillus saccharophilus TaxID=361277 RepID=UPI003D2E239B
MKNIFEKEYVISKGTNFDEELWFSSYSDEVLDKPEEEGGKPFTGLVYELYNNGNLNYYANYVNGFIEGELIEFYKSGKLKAIKTLIHGQSNGQERRWHENGKKSFEGDYKLGIALHFTEWDEAGEIVKVKSSPSETEVKLINSLTKNSK